VTASLLWGLVCFAVYALAVPLVLRLRGGLGPIGALFLTALAVNVCGCLAAWLWLPGWIFWQGGALYWCGFMILLDIFGAVKTSVSLEMLVNISLDPGREVALETVRRHGGEGGLLGRVESLVESGLARQQDDTYALTERGHSLARPVLAAQTVFGLSGSGMYSWGSGSAEDGRQ
jgi:hypothetical protein